MRILAKDMFVQFDKNMSPQLVFTISPQEMDLAKYNNALEKGKSLTLDVGIYREKRSLDSNAYMWVLLDKMARVLKVSKDFLYLIMLERYGVFVSLNVLPEAVDRLMREWRIAREMGTVWVGGIPHTQVQCYFGSSTYDTAEMSALIEGVVSECKDLGIETMTEEEIEAMNKEWEYGRG